MHNRRQRLISPVRRNVVGRLCISPTIVFLILSNQKARVRAITSPPIFVYVEYVLLPTTLHRLNIETRAIFQISVNHRRYLRGYFDEKRLD